MRDISHNHLSVRLLFQTRSDLITECAAAKVEICFTDDSHLQIPFGRKKCFGTADKWKNKKNLEAMI